MYYIYVYLNPMKPGIYNYGDISFKYMPFYIGMSKNKNRKLNHINDSIKNKKGRNKRKIELIQKIIKNKLKPIIITLYENVTESEALKKEIELIERIGRVNIKTGPLLNVLPGGQLIESELISLKLKKNKKLNTDKKLKVLQFDLNDVLIKEWDSATDASKSLKINKITSCCRGERITSGGFKWKYKEPENRIKRKIYKKRIDKPWNKYKIIKLDKDFNEIKLYNSIDDLEECLNKRMVKQACRKSFLYKNNYYKYKN